MIQIGLLSDTHGILPDEVLSFLTGCEEIWHAGDIGNLRILEILRGKSPVIRAVHGNIDGQEIRQQCKESEYFSCEDVLVFMTHIGGYPGRYARGIKDRLLELRPRIFVCGHSHILRVMYDPSLDILYINPGAAGKEGFHVMQTAVRFVIDGSDIRQLQVWEKKK
ncbi:MAG: metallophosphoesterase family protein [Bacteroidales bacterium]